MQNHILRINARCQRSIHVDAAHLQFIECNGLRGQHVAHLAGADTKSDGAKCAVRGGVGIATGNRRTRLSDALLGPHHVDDALMTRMGIEKSNVVLRTILAEFLDHALRERITVGLHRFVGRYNMVDRREGAVRELHLEPLVTQHTKGLRTRDLVN